MKRLLILISFLLLSNLSFSQDMISDIAEIADRINKDGALNMNFDYILENTERDFEEYKLQDAGKYRQLLTDLMDAPSIFTNVVAFNLLCDFDLDYAQKILFTCLDDTRSVRFYREHGFIAGDLFIIILMRHGSKVNLQNDGKFAEQLEEHILNNPDSKSMYKPGLIKKLETTPENHFLIRKLASEKKYPESLLKLAAYKDVNDKDLIIDYDGGFWTIKAVVQFPDKIFYPTLLKAFRSSWRKRDFSYYTFSNLYEALAQYPDEPETLKLFDKTVSVHKRFKKELLGKCLWDAINKYPNPKFEIFKSKINPNEEDYLTWTRLKLPSKTESTVTD